MKKILSAVVVTLLCFTIIPTVFAQNAVSTIANAKNRSITLKGTFVSFSYGSDNVNNTMTMKVTQVSPTKFKKPLLKKNVVIKLNAKTSVKGDPTYVALVDAFAVGDKLNVQVKVGADGTLVAKKVLNLTQKNNAKPVENLSNQGVTPGTGDLPAPTANADGYYEGIVTMVDIASSFALVQIGGYIYLMMGEGEVTYSFNGTPGAAFSIMQVGDTVKIKGRFCTDTKIVYYTEVQITHPMP